MRWPLDGGPEAFPVGPIINGVNYGTAQAHLDRGEGIANDIPAPEGEPLHPVHAATILFRFSDAQAGHAVDYQWWDDNGHHQLRYCHLREAPPVYPGDEVEENTVIGYVGSTGLSTGPHLHVVEWVDGERVDPSEYSLKVEDGMDAQKLTEALNDIWATREALRQAAVLFPALEPWQQKLFDAIVTIKTETGLQ